MTVFGALADCDELRLLDDAVAVVAGFGASAGFGGPFPYVRPWKNLGSGRAGLVVSVTERGWEPKGS